MTQAAHDLSGEWLSDGDGHWHVCKNDGCTVIPDKTEHTEGTDGKCTVCEYVITPHTHSYTEKGYDETHHWMECTCGAIDESTKTPHYATDDGNCTTAIKCVNCDKDAVAATTGHTDTDGDFLCDNTGCQVTVGTPPKDENEGINLPIVWN